MISIASFAKPRGISQAFYHKGQDGLCPPPHLLVAVSTPAYYYKYNSFESLSVLLLVYWLCTLNNVCPTSLCATDDVQDHLLSINFHEGDQEKGTDIQWSPCLYDGLNSGFYQKSFAQ